MITVSSWKSVVHSRVFDIIRTRFLADVLESRAWEPFRVEAANSDLEEVPLTQRLGIQARTLAMSMEGKSGLEFNAFSS